MQLVIPSFFISILKLNKNIFVVLTTVFMSFSVLATDTLGTQTLNESTAKTSILDANSLKTMVNEINQSPWPSYQKLQAFEKTHPNIIGDEKLWLLVRKAQAQNLLYLYPEFEQSVQTAQQLVNMKTPMEITIRLNLYSGIIFRRQGHYSKSVSLQKTTLRQAKKAGLPYLAVLAKHELAYTYGLSELFEMSLTDLQEAYVEAFALKDDFLIAVINEVYGAIYGYMHEYAKSIEYYQKALHSYQQLGYPYHIAEAVYGMASTYRYWEKWDLAIEHYKQYRQLVSFTPNKEITYFSAYGLGMTLAEKGDCVQAIKVIDQALLLEGIGDYNAELYKRKAVCFIEQNKLADAEIALNKADEIFSALIELKGTRWQLEVDKIRAQLAYAHGKTKEAYDLLNSYYQRYMSVFKKTSSERLVQVRSALELDRKSVEISLLHQQAKVQQLEVEQQKQKNHQQSYLMFIAVSFIIFILVVMFIQQRNNRKILALSIRDPLSNLYNRRYLFGFLTKLIKATDPNKGDVSVMLIDIDNFKEINDQYGHPFGDEVIRQIAKIGQDTLRVEDIMGRIGGEEFLCALPRTDTKQCLQIAQRLLENISNYTFETSEKHVVKVTVSIGIASTSVTANECNILYTQADKALYHAKNNGKNSISQYRSYMEHAYQSHTELTCGDSDIIEEK